MLRRPSESRQMVQRSESCDHAAAGRKRTSSLAVAIPKMQKERPDEWRHPRLEIGRIANTRAHVRRRLAEAEYLDERDSLRREHKKPRISRNIVETETGFLGNLPSDVAIEIDTAAGDISRIEHAGRKVNVAGTGGVGIHDAQ